MLVVVDGVDLDSLADEAARERERASAVLLQERGHSDELDAYRGPRRHRVGTGERLSALHEGPLLARHLAAFGRRLWPTRASYLYFGPGDHVDFHQDAPQCAVTAAACLDGATPTLLLVAGDRQSPLALRRRLDAPDRAAVVAGCDRVRLVPGRVVLFEGHAVPHALEDPDGSVTLAACCFAGADA